MTALALLQHISDADHLPIVLTSDADVERFRTLLSAGHVIGAMQAIPAGGGWQVGVHVTEITPKGRRALSRVRGEESAHDRAASSSRTSGASPPVLLSDTCIRHVGDGGRPASG